LGGSPPPLVPVPPLLDSLPGSFGPSRLVIFLS
jgi:hypothetical protein